MIRDKNHLVEVEISWASDGTAVATGIRVRRPVPTIPYPTASGPLYPTHLSPGRKQQLEWDMRRQKQDLDPELLWPEPAEPAALSPRTVRRLPLSRYVAAALAAAEPIKKTKGSLAFGSTAPEVRRVMTPPGRPKRGKSEGFYKDIARAYREFAKQGKRPVPEIARRKKVSTNTVHQWVFRARELEFLERTKGR